MIIAATDFTNEAREAMLLAAAFARATKTPLRLIYVLEPDSISPLPFKGKWTDLEGERFEAAQALLRVAAESLGKGLDVHTAVIVGEVTSALAREAIATRPELVVVGGCAEPGASSHRGVADELATALPCPLLVARPHAAPLATALRHGRQLRVLVAVDHTLSADAAIAWVRQLRTSVACDIIVRRYYWPPFEHNRLGIPMGSASQGRDTQVAEALEREVRSRFVGLGGQGALDVDVEPRWEAVAEGLVHGARDLSADLVVVGSHQRGAVSRALHGSTSRYVLRYSDCPVVCVGARAHLETPARPVHNVLVAVDLSDQSSVAMRYAYEIVRDGLGRVTILNVAREPLHGWGASDLRRPLSETERDEIRLRLRRLIPDGAEIGIKTDILVEDGADPAARILEVAERTNVDAIVVGSHGGGVVAHGVLGSVARRVADKANQPVLIARHRPL